MTAALAHLYAAAASPTLRTHISLLRALFEWAGTTTRMGLGEGHAALREIAQLPPCDVGHDPRLVLTTETGHRIDPGAVWDPLGALATADDLGPAAELLIERLGFLRR